MTHNHREIALHSLEQAAMFYASGTELGYKVKDLKERAKTHFKRECFNSITKSELIWLIDKLIKKKEERDQIVRRMCQRCKKKEQDIPKLPCKECRMELFKIQADYKKGGESVSVN